MSKPMKVSSECLMRVGDKILELLPEGYSYVLVAVTLDPLSKGTQHVVGDRALGTQRVRRALRAASARIDGTSREAQKFGPGEWENEEG